MATANLTHSSNTKLIHQASYGGSANFVVCVPLTLRNFGFREPFNTGNIDLLFIVNTAPSRRKRTVLPRTNAEIVPLAALLAAATFALVFGLLANEVFAGSTAGVDRNLLLLLRSTTDLSNPLGPAWVEESARDLSSLGSNSLVGLIVFATALFLVFVGNGRAAALVLAAVAGGTLLFWVLKIGYSRPRPDIVPPLARVFTTSFPSGHTALSAAVYPAVCALLARTVVRRPARVYLVTLGVFLTVLVGVTRVYLGLHYPSDVVAGWCAGAAWAMFCWAIALELGRRGKIGTAGPIL